jgi:uncharacterized protein with NRDE domain
MCLIAWNWQPDGDTPLVLLSNRDEFYARPTLPLQWWNTPEQGGAILSGRDLQGGGTWLGLSRGARVAALTNFRQAQPPSDAARSRGVLVTQFLESQQSSAAFLAQLATQVDAYNPFNLLVFDGQQLMGLESRGARVLTLQSGFGAVSNAGFQTPWPKLTKLELGLKSELARDSGNTTDLMTLLQDPTLATDDQLPQTGIPSELERQLSSIFVMPIRGNYGTRASSVLQVHRTDSEFIEQTFDPAGSLTWRHETFQH